jgi:hypothetical protein
MSLTATFPRRGGESSAACRDPRWLEVLGQPADRYALVVVDGQVFAVAKTRAAE